MRVAGEAAAVGHLRDRTWALTRVRQHVVGVVQATRQHKIAHREFLRSEQPTQVARRHADRHGDLFGIQPLIGVVLLDVLLGRQQMARAER